MSALNRIEEVVRHTDTAFLDERWEWDTDPHQIASELYAAVREEVLAEGNGSREADATPDKADRYEARLAQLLDTIRTHGGKWSTGTLQEVRRRDGGSPQRGTARRDLAELCRRGHLHQHGAGDDRFYTLKRRGGGA